MATRTENRLDLTRARVAAIATPSGKQPAYTYDTRNAHLCVRVTPAGARSYVFFSKLNGNQIRVTLGDVETWSPDEARKRATELQKIVDEGRDPREVKREAEAARLTKAAAERAAAEAAKAEAERQARYTLRALCDAYVGALERAGKGKSAISARSLFKCHIDAETGAKPARAVTAHEVAALVRKVREAGKERTAGILRSYLSAAYNAAKRAPFDSALPANLIPYGIEHNPVDAIPAIAVRRGDRTLTASELRAYIGHLLRVGQEVGQEADMANTALLVALYAGGQRVAQLLRAKVADFNEDAGTLRLWDGKGKRTQPREHLLPLAPHAAGIVAALADRAKARETERARVEKRTPDLAAQWLFSTYGTVPMTPETASIRVGDICTAMGCEAFTLRDIRRTVETMLAGLGISKDTRAQLLSHGISGVQSAHYDRHDYADEKRAALVALEARLNDIRTAERTPPNVVAMKPRAA